MSLQRIDGVARMAARWTVVTKGSFAKRSAGFTLVEALVALVVLSTGLLGVAAMELRALQGAHAAYQRSVATLAAQDARERLWAEVAGLPGVSACPAGRVDDVERAWRAHWTGSSGVTVVLPGFTKSALGQAAPECKFKITVAWDETRFGNTEESFVYAVRLPEGE